MQFTISLSHGKMSVSCSCKQFGKAGARRAIHKGNKPIMKQSTLYARFLDQIGELADLNGAAALLSWDQETYMPEGGQQARGQQMALLSALAHQRFTSPEMGEMLQKLQGSEAPDEEDARIAVERAAWEYDRETKVPEEWVRAMAMAQSEAVAVWTKARQDNDFAKFRPHLERLLSLRRQQADLLRKTGQTRYDALLEGYERGMVSSEIEALFTELRQSVVPLVQSIQKSDQKPSTDCLQGTFDTNLQWQFGLEVLRAMGFDFQRGRQDKSAHPFTTSFHPTDVRITTRVFEDNLSSALFSTIHEGGHALYDQGFRPEDWRTPLGASISLGIHESQSRMWENLVGRSLPFWSHFFPRLQNLFLAQLGQTGLEEFYRAINASQPSLIRVESDEVTYSLHIILRFEIEKALLEGTLAPADLPEAWNAKIKEYLGLEVPDDKQGCLQDIHWAWGMVGYFPTYTLGNFYSVQLFTQAKKEIPELEDHISKGKLTALTDWLRAKVHRVGTRRLAKELVHDITGQALSAQPFVQYLETKYRAIYRL